MKGTVVRWDPCYQLDLSISHPASYQVSLSQLAAPPLRLARVSRTGAKMVQHTDRLDGTAITPNRLGQDHR